MLKSSNRTANASASGLNCAPKSSASALVRYIFARWPSVRASGTPLPFSQAETAAFLSATLSATSVCVNPTASLAVFSRPPKARRIASVMPHFDPVEYKGITLLRSNGVRLLDMEKEMSAIRKAALRLGGQARIALLLGYKDRRNVAPWFRKSEPASVPEADCTQIERLTFGEVTCEMLRPDLNWRRVKDKTWGWHKDGRPLLDVAQEAAQ